MRGLRLNALSNLNGTIEIYICKVLRLKNSRQSIKHGKRVDSVSVNIMPILVSTKAVFLPLRLREKGIL